MSTTPITPTSNLGAVAGSADPAAVTGGIVDAAPQAAASVQPASPSPSTAPTQPAPAQGGSRLARIISAVANVADTALAGIPDRGRPSFAGGLGEGARAEKQDIANQQAIKFQSFQDQVRLAELHAQDLKLQNDTQAQSDAHVKAELDNRALANSLGIKYDTLASDGDAVMGHLQAQTAANGAASVPAGVHLSGDGETINIPQNDKATQDGQKQMYSMLAPAYGLPALSPNADFVPPQLMNMLTNKIHGYEATGPRAGQTPSHDDLPGRIGALQVQRDQMAKNGAPPQVLQAVDNTLGIYKANLDALDKHAADVDKQKKQNDLDIQNSPTNIAASNNKIAQNEQAKLNVQNSPANQAAAARGEGLKTTAAQNAKNEGALDSVAFDPNYQNPDGTKGANVVMSKADASNAGLKFYKADPNKINAVVAGMNDVQNKLNQLAAVTSDPTRMKQVQPQVAADMLRHGHGIELGAFGTKLDTSTIDADLAAADSAMSNQATRDYVTAMLGAHEALTQLPRLQTFGQSSRMTQQQIEAAQRQLPQPGDSPALAAQKMTSLQGMIDPLRKQVPHMPGAEKTPSWLEQRQQQQRQVIPPMRGSNLGAIVSGQ